MLELWEHSFRDQRRREQNETRWNSNCNRKEGLHGSRKERWWPIRVSSWKDQTPFNMMRDGIFAAPLEHLWPELNRHLSDTNRHHHLLPDALMVLLTLTPAAKSAVELYNQLSKQEEHGPSSDPSLSEPTVGAPVSHAQLIQVARFLRKSHLPNKNDFRLDTLLKGANIYVPPPKPKPQPVRIHLTLPPSQLPFADISRLRLPSTLP
jgi:hypothetical protein